MAVPKRKSSKARRDKRRNNVWKLDAPALMKCPQCGEYKRPHRLCGIAVITTASRSSRRKPEKVEEERSFSIFMPGLHPV